MNSQRWECCLALERLLLLHLFLATSIQGHSQRQVITVSGNNVSLHISDLPALSRVTWFYTANQKIVEWESNRTNFFNSKFKNRASLDESYALCIYKVQKEDSSTYILRVLKDSGKEEDWTISLEVLDPVRKPGIKIQTLQEVNNSCHLKLSCEISGQSANYTCYYTCQASNPVSSKNDTIYFSKLCKLAKSSGVAWIATWLIVMVPIVPGLLWT
ncbi:CD48 antigen [Vulpes lagopus]